MHARGHSDVMGFAGNPVDIKSILGNFFSHTLKTRASQGEKVFVKHSLKRTMVRVDGETWQPVQIKGTFGDGPNNRQTLELDGRVSLLGRGQPLGPTVDDFKTLDAL